MDEMVGLANLGGQKQGWDVAGDRRQLPDAPWMIIRSWFTVG